MCIYDLMPVFVLPGLTRGNSSNFSNTSKAAIGPASAFLGVERGTPFYSFSMNRLTREDMVKPWTRMEKAMMI